MVKRSLVISGLAVLAASLSGCFVPILIPVPIPQVGSDQGAYVPSKPDLGMGENRFKDQTISWSSCGGGFECADVAAPMKWDDPSSEPISIHLEKYPATGSNKLGTIFVNPGGPGASGADFVRDGIGYAVSDELAEHFDIIGWDPRGVGKSSPVVCYNQEDMDDYLFGDPRPYSKYEYGSDEWIEIARKENRAFGEACLENTGELLGYVDTLSTVKDLDLLRHLVGDSKLNYIGYSYGTTIGSIYAETFPENVGKLVLDGAVAPGLTMFDVVLQQQQGFENATRAYLADCLQRSSCPFSGTVDSALIEIGQMIDRVDQNPLQAADGRWISSGTFITAIIMPLYSDTSWPLLDDLFKEMRVGDTEMAQWLSDYYYSRNLGFYEDNSTEAFTAIDCLDYMTQASNDEMRASAKVIAAASPILGKYAGFSEVGCQEWPIAGATETISVRGGGADPILVIGTTGDPATPYVWAEQLANELESGILITLNGEGHCAYTTGNPCIVRLVDDYFISGTVPKSDPDCSF